MKRFSRIDPVLTVSGFSGLLLAVAFPRPDLFPVAWFALVPMLLVMPRRPFAAGFSAGGVFFALVLYWLNIVLTTYGGLPLLPAVLAYLLLVAYLALFFAAATWLSCRCREVLHLPVLLTLPILWVALEYLRGFLLSGFPWALLGYSQQSFSIAIQSADVTGVYGVSLMLVAVNCALAWVLAEPKTGRAWLGFAAVVLLVISHCGYGAWRASQPLEERTDELRVALIQGNIDQSQKWEPAVRQPSLNRYLGLSRTAAQDSPDLIVWPEAATPFFLQDDDTFSAQVRDLAGQLDTALLIGSPSYEKPADGDYRYFNSAFLLADDGRELGRSDKVHLVPFGEYVPLGTLLPFVTKLVEGAGDFSPGRVSPLRINGHQFGVLICYEAIFPGLARDYVKEGADLLINLTNDAWFGRSSAPYQHLAMARFRAIENRVWLARAANTGVSAFISPSGRIVASGPIFQPLQMTGTVGLGAAATFYTRYGDVFAFACLLLSGAFLLLLLVKRRSHAVS